MKLKLFFAGTIAFLVFIFSQCKKKEIDNEIESVIDFTTFQNEFAGIYSTFHTKVQFKEGLKRLGQNHNNSLALNCPSDSLLGDTSGWFSGTYSNSGNLPGLFLSWSAGCNSDGDSRKRSGTIRTSFSKPYYQIGSSILFQPQGLKFFLDNGTSVNLSGNFTSSRTQTNSLQFYGQNISLSDGNWNSNFSLNELISIVSGQNDSLTQNEIIEISGDVNGTSRNGKKFSAVIKSPLIKKATFKWITSGTVELTPEGLGTRIIDFGDGSEDNLATFEINGSVFTFNLR